MKMDFHFAWANVDIFIPHLLFFKHLGISKDKPNDSFFSVLFLPSFF